MPRAARAGRASGRCASWRRGLGGEPAVWCHGYGAGVLEHSSKASPGTRQGSWRSFAAPLRPRTERWWWRIGRPPCRGWRSGAELRGPVSIMEAIKRQFDPNGTLNPGRFVGSI